MSGEDMTPDVVADRARGLVEEKVALIRALADARNRLEVARAGVEVAARVDAEAYQAASRSWTATELRRLGFSAPERRVPGRPGSGGRRPRAVRPEAPAAVEGDGGVGLSAVG